MSNYPTPPGAQPPSEPPAPPAGYGYPQQPYQQQYAYPPYAYPQQRGTNGFAIASLVCAFLCSPLGLVFGFIARSQIKERGDGGEGLALAGIILSAIFLALGILFVALGAAVGSRTNFNIYVPPQPT